jgi:hypothetical protein
VEELRSSEVVYKDSCRFNEGGDRFFLDHCIVWKNGFSKPYDHGFRESVVLDEFSWEQRGWAHRWKMSLL